MTDKTESDKTANAGEKVKSGPGRQNQRSRQRLDKRGNAVSEQRPGDAPERPSAGTADIERGSGDDQDSGRDGSMVNDSTGAYKERP